MNIIKVEDYGLSEKKGLEVSKAFNPMIKERDALSSVYNQLLTCEVSQENCLKASELRKKLVKVRTGIASIHRTQKAFHLAAGKYVDAWKNKETLPVTQMEEKLRDIENHFINIEIEKLDKLQESRILEVEKYYPDLITDVFKVMIRTMNGEVFTAYISSLRDKHNLAVKEQKELERLQAERIENERLENERIRIENKRLQDEAIENKRLEDIEIKKRLEAKKKLDDEAEKLRLENERKIQSEKNRVAKIEAEAERKAKIEKDRYDAKIKKAKDEAEKLRAENQKRLDDEAEKLRLIEVERQKELLKGDQDKFNDLINDLESLKIKYSFKSEVNINKYSAVSTLIDKIINHVK